MKQTNPVQLSQNLITHTYFFEGVKFSVFMGKILL